MEINSLQFNPILGQQITSKIEQEQTKDFDAIFEQAAREQDDKALKDACVKLESYMLSQLFKQMKKSMVSEDGLIPKGDYEKTFEDYIINNQSEDMAKAGGIGLADMMYKQMTNVYAKQIKTDNQNSINIDQEV
ncbi:rod-binding protein [Cellulosilyticum sp. I15G10I2]|uniref:rod-binding protein n=1 Tax=Cellulosilyticum sp. I15G10I2 TaxID=1892843 RepID=UPI00085C11D5|nr:rod-binding protein [Cellulosilyticum sp. I15G10I2]